MAFVRWRAGAFTPSGPHSTASDLAPAAPCQRATRPEYSTQQPPWVDPATFARVRLYRASKDQEAADDVTQRAPGSDPAPDRSAERGPPEDWGAEDETQMPTVELRGLAHEPVFPAGAGMNRAMRFPASI